MSKGKTIEIIDCLRTIFIKLLKAIKRIISGKENNKNVIINVYIE